METKKIMPKSKSTFEYVGEHFPPIRAYANDAGLDLCIQEDAIVYPGETAIIPTGVKFYLEPGEVVHVFTRSSTFKKRVTIIPTVIDCGYREVCHAFVTNVNPYPVEVKAGDRLVQAVLMKCYAFENEDLPDIERNGKGIGSSDEVYNR